MNLTMVAANFYAPAGCRIMDILPNILHSSTGLACRSALSHVTTRPNYGTGIKGTLRHHIRTPRVSAHRVLDLSNIALAFYQQIGSIKNEVYELIAV